MFSLLLYSFSGINDNVKQDVEKQSPVAEILSAEKARHKLEDGELWCITYQPKNGDVERLVLLEDFPTPMIMKVRWSDFERLGCGD